MKNKDFTDDRINLMYSDMVAFEASCKLSIAKMQHIRHLLKVEKKDRMINGKPNANEESETARKVDETLKDLVSIARPFITRLRRLYE